MNQLVNTLTAHDIAHRWAATATQGPLHNPGCDPYDLDDTTSVWQDLYLDLDWEQAFLLTVHTNHTGTDPGTGQPITVTVLDQLAVYEYPGSRFDVSWRDAARLFFDVDQDWLHVGRKWFADFVREIEQLRTDEHQRGQKPEFRQSLAEHSRSVRTSDHELARKLRLGHLIVEPD